MTSKQLEFTIIAIVDLENTKLTRRLVEVKPAKEVYNAVIQFKGAGPETALLIAAFDVLRFDSAKVFPVHFGLNPRHNQAGRNAGKTTLSGPETPMEEHSS